MKKLVYFFALLAFPLFFSCSDDEELSTNCINPSIESIYGTWTVCYFWDQTVRTEEFSGYNLEINSDGTAQMNTPDGSVTAYFEFDSGNSSEGTCSKLTLSFDSHENSTIDAILRELDEIWAFTNQEGSKIELEEVISDNPPEILHLEKQ